MLHSPHCDFNAGEDRQRSLRFELRIISTVAGKELKMQRRYVTLDVFTEPDRVCGEARRAAEIDDLGRLDDPAWHCRRPVVLASTNWRSAY